MDKLQKVKITLRESERWFRVIFNQTFGFIALMQLMGIFIEGNQTALKFGGITSKVIRCPLVSWSDFLRDVEGCDRQEILTQVWRSLRKLSKFQEVGLLQIHKLV